MQAGGGRTLRVVSDGDPSGLPVLVHYGTPMDGTFYEAHVEDARRRGIRLLSYDRPGYGGSTPDAGRSVADCVPDVEAIADALGLERLGVWGVSGGGPHALACGALLGGRVVAIGVLGSVAPADAEELDWFAGMGEDNLDEFGAALQGRDALEQYLAENLAERLPGDSVHLRDELQTLLTPIDAAALTGEFAEFLDASMRGALVTGVDGWLDDDLAFAKPWGFEVGDVAVPVVLWHGDEDRFVPPAHGRWLAERLANVDAHLSAEDGHLTLITRRVPEVHAWLVERLQA